MKNNEDVQLKCNQLYNLKYLYKADMLNSRLHKNISHNLTGGLTWKFLKFSVLNWAVLPRAGPSHPPLKCHHLPICFVFYLSLRELLNAEQSISVYFDRYLRFVKYIIYNVKALW